MQVTEALALRRDIMFHSSRDSVTLCMMPNITLVIRCSACGDPGTIAIHMIHRTSLEQQKVASGPNGHSVASASLSTAAASRENVLQAAAPWTGGGRRRRPAMRCHAPRSRPSLVM